MNENKNIENQLRDTKQKLNKIKVGVRGMEKEEYTVLNVVKFKLYDLII